MLCCHMIIVAPICQFIVVFAPSSMVPFILCHSRDIFGFNDLNLDGSEEQGVDGEDVGEDADAVDEDAVADKEMDLPPDLPHVRTIGVFLQYQRRTVRSGTRGDLNFFGKSICQHSECIPDIIWFGDS